MAMIRDNINEEPRFVRMAARYPSRCAECEDRIYEDDRIIYDVKEGKAYHEECGESLMEG